MLLEVKNISKSFKGRKLLKDITFMIYKGNKIGLVGDNGVGKSTLLKIIIGQLQADEGDVRFHGTYGYLPQHIEIDNGLCVYDYIKDKTDHATAMEILSKFGFKDKHDQRVKTLSGGEKTKLYLAKTLIGNPELLILDEPTNHIDMDTIKWIEEFLKDFKGAVLVVTHDRYFLDEVVNEIFELHTTQIKGYSGNFSFYSEQKRIEKEQEWMAYEKYNKKKKELEKAAQMQLSRAKKYNDMSQNDFQRGKASKIAKRAKAMVSRIDQLEKKDKPKNHDTINIKFDQTSEKTAPILISAEELSKEYDRQLFQDISFNLSKNTKVALVGENGVGKTTLIKAVVGKETVNGRINIPPSVKMGYFSQELEELDLDNTILEEVKKVSKDETLNRTFLGSFLFKQNDVFKKIRDLSQGERVKVAFVKLLVSDVNLLILDEPTNYLDIASREKLEEALLQYDGTLLFVSHDRYFIKKIATEVWEMTKDNMTAYIGDYNYYLSKKTERTSRDTDSKEKILMKELRLSQISGELDLCTNEEDKEKLNNEFLQIARDLRTLKSNN